MWRRWILGNLKGLEPFAVASLNTSLRKPWRYILAAFAICRAEVRVFEFLHSMTIPHSSIRLPPMYATFILAVDSVRDCRPATGKIIFEGKRASMLGY